MSGLCSKCYKYLSSPMRSGLVLSISLFTKKKDMPDALLEDEPTKKISTETGWDRLKIMFSRDRYGDLSPQLDMVNECTTAAFIFGGMYGGITHMRLEKDKYLRENKLTSYMTKMDAERRYGDQMILGFVKGALKVAPRIGFFAFCLTTSLYSITAYTGQTAILNFSIAGAASGALYKLKDGPRPMAAGAAVGLGLGTIMGIAVCVPMYLSGTSLEDLNILVEQDIATKRKYKEKHNEEKKNEILDKQL